MGRYWLFVFFFALINTFALATAQELVTNGTFDLNTDDWYTQNPTYGPFVHDPLDAGGDPASGSALFTNLYPGAATDLATTQCVPTLPADRDYVFGGTLRIADGTVTNGHGSIQIWFWEDSNCTTVVGGSMATLSVTTSTTGWVRVGAIATAPVSAVAARLTLWNNKDDAGGELGIHFDNVFLRTVSIFTDGFESGGTTAWN